MPPIFEGANIKPRLDFRCRCRYGARHQSYQQFLGEYARAARRSRQPFSHPVCGLCAGDGLQIGPGHEKEWTMDLISEETPWVSEYRGCGDCLPATRFRERTRPGDPTTDTGTALRCASPDDPLGFAELDKVAPPPLELKLLQEQIGELDKREQELEAEIPLKVTEWQELAVVTRACRGIRILPNRTRRSAKRLTKKEMRSKDCAASTRKIAPFVKDSATPGAASSGYSGPSARPYQEISRVPRQHSTDAIQSACRRLGVDQLECAHYRHRRTAAFWRAVLGGQASRYWSSFLSSLNPSCAGLSSGQ